MGRGFKPHAPKVRQIEVSEKNIKLRWILVCVLVGIAAIAILWGIFGSRQKAGWYTVKSDSGGLHCGNSFVLNYEFGAGEMSAAKEGKELQKLYTALTEKAWQLFCHEAGQSEWGNLYRLNTHLNQEISIDPALYQALKVFETQKCRLHYLGPVYAAYDQVFFADDPVSAAEADPGQNEENRQYVLQLAKFAADPNAVQLELRQDSKVFLHVSEEYAGFLKENMVETVIDFGWLLNALILDYMAGRLKDEGFTNGNITSIDGFAGNLDRRGGGYQLNIFNRREDKAELVAAMAYSKPTSVVYLRTYDSTGVYQFAGGRTVTYFADIGDGQCKTALPNLVSYSETAGCTQIALQIAPSFIAYNFSANGLNALTEEGIYSVWFEDNTLRYNQPDLHFSPKNDAYIIAANN